MLAIPVETISVVIGLLSTILLGGIFIGKKLMQLDNVSTDVAELKTTVKEILARLGQLSLDVAVLRAAGDVCDTHLPDAINFAQAHSPLSLTDKGIEASKRINAEGLFNVHKAELYALLDDSKLKNAYDIQGETFYVIQTKFLDLLSEEELTELKNVAYANNEMIESYLIIFQIMLRDDVLKAKNINIEAIEKLKVNRK